MTETDPDKRMRDIIAGGDVNVDRHSTNSVDDHSSKDDHSQSTDIAAGTINVYHGTKKGGNRGLLVAIFILIGIIVAGVIVGGVMFVNMSNTPAQNYTNTITQPDTKVSTTVPVTTEPENVYHSVSFNTGGYGSIQPQTVMDGGYISSPASPSRDGYTFAGWYTSPSYTTRWNFNQPVTSDLDLYAKWTVVQPTTYSVSFNTGGYGSIQPQTVMDGGYISSPASPSRDGYTFAGWYTSPSYTTKWNFNQPVTSDLDLYAKWTVVQPTTYSVSFNTGGYGFIESQTVNEGEFASSPEMPTRNGFIFDGWYTSTAYTTKWNFNQPITADMTLFAKWTASTHTINFNTGGYGSVASQTVNDGCCASYPTTPTRSGFTFDGWYTSPDYTTKWDFNQPITVDITLYAKWTAPEGSAENPISISTADDFMKIYQKPSLHYKLTAPIDLTGYSIPDDINFSGSLDGNGYTITGNTNGLNSISLDQTKYSSIKYFGLFSTNSGTIKNLKLVNFGVDGNEQDYAGIADSTKAAYFGCIAGLNNGSISDVTLENCKVRDMRMWGGCGLIAGYNKGSISNCIVNGGHIAGDCDIGGIAGINEGTVRSCSVHGSGSEFISFFENSWLIFTGNNGRSIGGIVGNSSSSSSLIESCSVSDIKISYTLKVDRCYIGSIAGSNFGRVSGCTAAAVSPTMEKCGANNGTLE